ncbi:MAG: hypothetical protein IMY67_12230 [Bacteroidetes bacterium]|nr:hypothetical protein [Bacteroidota bacterium]
MKTQKEIIAKIYEINEEDILGFGFSTLVPFLDPSNAKGLVENIGEASDWKRQTSSISYVIKDYMPFAFEKANNFKGISASRTMTKMGLWLWLDNKNELSKDCHDYKYYGKDQLVCICEEYGIDYTQYDDGVRLNSEPEAE